MSGWIILLDVPPPLEGPSARSGAGILVRRLRRRRRRSAGPHPLWRRWGRLLAGMRAAVNGLLATGNDVILDEMPIEASTMPTWRRDLRASASCWVYVTAPLEVLERRERERMSGRKSGNARGHHRLGQGGDWDMVVNTDTATPGDAAAEIIRRCPFL
nr:hypothetical protein [Mobilicoccus caccae]